MSGKGMRKREMKTEDREERYDTMRDSEMRDREIRENLMMGYYDKLHIPAHIIPDDVKYYWGRKSYRDRPDDSRMMDMSRKGWTAVPAHRHPELVFQDPFGRTHISAGYIERDGLILMERKKVYCKIEEEAMAKRNMQLLNSIPGSEKLMNNPVIPGFNYSSPVTFGA